MLKKIPNWILITLGYLTTHLVFLTKLPVFADEAIYIRWAQLIQYDLPRYAFFSMADGKPPLFMWILSLVLRLFNDPLWGGRFLSVMVGLGLIFVMRAIVQEFKGGKLAEMVAMLAGTFLPFWFFHARLALMDMLLTLFIALSFLFALRISNQKAKSRKLIANSLALALSFGGALLTKTPALFAIPIIALMPFYSAMSERKPLGGNLIKIGLGGFLGCLIFLGLRFSPLFGALFSRSTDFTFKFNDLIGGEWHFVLFSSLPRNIFWILQYLTPEFCLFAILGLMMGKKKKEVGFLLICGLIFALPLTLFGRVLWPRYFLPATLFFTLAASIGLSEVWRTYKYNMLVLLLIAFSVFSCLRLIASSYFDLATLPLVKEDRSQYLTEWSAGFGNKEVRDFVKARQVTLASQNQTKIIVLTEGSFGTLPDGLLMYFHGGNKALNLEVHGIGLPIKAIPVEYLSRAKTNEVYLMVNSNRLQLHDDQLLKPLFSVPRPSAGPSLLFFRVEAQ